SVQFIDQSQDKDGKIVNWSWNFGDGETSFKQNPTHSYADDGEYIVELQVTDDFGVEENISKEIYVSNEAPKANFSINRTVVRSGELIQFEDQSYDPDGNIVNWTWSFGDGNRSYLENPTHKYIKDDNYLVELTTEDDDGKRARKMTNIEVRNGFPRAKFNYSPSKNITTQDTLDFHDQSDDIDGHIVNWTWDFDDSTKSYLENPEHRFSDDGIYNVSLTVRDNDGAEDTFSMNIKVKNTGPEADFTYSPLGAFTYTKIEFEDQSTDVDGSIKDWKWDFGDENTSNLQNPIHEYVDDGSYLVKLSVTDDDGCVSNITKEIIIENRPPQADFVYEYKDGDKTSKLIFFTDNSSDLDGEIVNWTWHVGEDGIVYGKDIEHEFSSAGQYDVKLTITDDDGDSSSIEKTINIREKSASGKGDIIVDNILFISIILIILISAILAIWWVYKDKMKHS
ncbi:MAG: PKD domain-containing protein, partial [Thermoplasmatota archaeon]